MKESDFSGGKDGDIMSEYIITKSKKYLDPLNPDNESILIEDIAHALSRICRANAQIPIFFSVAQHSILCCREAIARGLSYKICLACLLHDASESYMADIIRPVKKNLDAYIKIEKCLQDAVYKKFTGTLTEAELKIVSEIDDAMLYWEFFILMEVRLSEEKPIKTTPNFKTEDFSTVEKEFTQLFNTLSEKL